MTVARARHPQGPAGTNPPVRVLAVIDTLRRAGAEGLLVGLARRAGAAGIDLSVATLAEPGGLDTVVDDLHDAGVDVHRLGARRLLDPQAATRLSRLIRRLDVDLVHAHLRYAVTMAPVAARSAHRPVVCSFHHVPGQLSPRERVKERLAVRAANVSDLVLAVSHAQLDAFERRYTLRRGRWRVLHNGVDLTPFVDAAGGELPDDLRGRARGRPVAAMVARLRDGKGHDVALEAWPRVLEHVPDAHLLVVGDGPLQQRFEESADRLGLGDHVTFTGSRRDVPAIVGGAELVVLPSRTEALPTTLIEAAAAATPVVATEVGGVPEVVEHDRTGRLVPVDDVDAFADEVVGLLTDDAARRRLGEQAQQRALERFDLGRWADRLADLYRETVAAARRVPA